MTKCIITHHKAHVVAALAAADELGVAVAFQSPPRGMATLGGLYLKTMFADVAPPHKVVIDCGDAPAHALTAIRTGFTHILFSGDEAICTKLASMPAVTLAVPAEGALELAKTDSPSTAIRTFFASAPVA